MLDRWHRRSYVAHKAHVCAGTHFARLHYWIGVPTVFLTSAVSTTVFATLEHQAGLGLKIVVGLASIAAGSLAAMQTFLKLSERAEHHRLAAAGYSSLRRHIEAVLALPAIQRGSVKSLLFGLERKYAKLTRVSPHVPDFIWGRAARGALAAPGTIRFDVRSSRPTTVDSA